jgi:hypothetical protein
MATVAMNLVALSVRLARGRSDRQPKPSLTGCADCRVTTATFPQAMQPVHSAGSPVACDCEQCQAPAKEEDDCKLNRIFGDKPLFPNLKNQKSGPLTYSLGGQLRHRYMNEENRLRPPGGCWYCDGRSPERVFAAS